MCDIICLVLEFEEHMSKEVLLNRQAEISRVMKEYDIWVDFQYDEHGTNDVVMEALWTNMTLSGTKVLIRGRNHLIGVITPDASKCTSEDLIPNIIYASKENGVDENRLQQAWQILNETINKITSLVKEILSILSPRSVFLIFLGPYVLRENHYHECNSEHLVQTLTDFFSDGPTEMPVGVVRVLN